MIPTRSTLTLTIALGTALLVAGCGGEQQSASSAGDARAAGSTGPFEYLAADSAFVAYVDIQKVMTSPTVAKNIEDALAQDADAREVLDALQLDLKNDVKAAAVGGKVPQGPSSDADVLIALEASFDLDAAVKLAQEKEPEFQAAPFSEGGLTGYKVTTPDGDDIHVVQDGGVVLIAPLASQIQRGIDTKKSGRNVLGGNLVKNNRSKIDSAAELWVLMDLTSLGDDMAMPMGSGDPPKLFLLSGSFTQGLDLAASVVFNSAEEANQMTQMLSGIVMMMGGQAAAENPELKPVMDALSITANGPSMDIALVLTEKQMKDLQAAMEQMRP